MLYRQDVYDDLPDVAGQWAAFHSLKAEGGIFYGAFSAPNRPDPDRFPSKPVRYQRNVKDNVDGVVRGNALLTSPGKLVDADPAHLLVAESTDPFVFYEYAQGLSIRASGSSQAGRAVLNWTDERSFLGGGQPVYSVRSLPVASTSLDPNAAWQPMNYLISGTNGQFTMEVDTSNPHMFFRLRRQISDSTLFPVTARAVGSGSLQPSGVVLKGFNQSLTVMAAPNPGYGMGPWYLDGQTAQWGGTSFNLGAIDDEHSILATFIPNNDLRVCVFAQLPLGSTNPVPVGTNVTLRITVDNRSLNPATGVTVSSYLPQNFAVVSAAYSQGKANQFGANLVWSVGNLGRHASATATITVVPLSPTAGSFTASAIGNEPEADLTNNQAAALILVQ